MRARREQRYALFKKMSPTEQEQPNLVAVAEYLPRNGPTVSCSSCGVIIQHMEAHVRSERGGRQHFHCFKRVMDLEPVAFMGIGSLQPPDVARMFSQLPPTVVKILGGGLHQCVSCGETMRNDDLTVKVGAANYHASCFDQLCFVPGVVDVLKALGPQECRRVLAKNPNHWGLLLHTSPKKAGGPKQSTPGAMPANPWSLK